jgi:ribosome-associated protein
MNEKITPSSEAVKEIIFKVLDDNQAENVIDIDLTGKSTLADNMVVASGRNNRHVGAMADYVMSELKNAGLQDVRVEGMPACDWVLIDAHDVIVHIFRPEVRDFYNLEKMWQAARQAE